MDLRQARFPPLKVLWTQDDLPHCVIEVNQRCNLHCFGCYKDKSALQKTVPEVCGEIDLMISRRNLSTLSFAGGEPLMHPELEAMVAHAARQGIRPVVVTHGSLLTRERLESLRAQGLVGVLIHIDRLQGRRPDSPELSSEAEYNPLREGYVRMAEEQGLDVGLAVTLYQQNLEELPDVIELGMRQPACKYMLVTGYSQVANLNPREDERFERKAQPVTSSDCYRMMEAARGAHPTMYLPSSHRDHEMRWLFYLSAVSRDGSDGIHEFSLSGKHRHGLERVLRLDRERAGKFSFDRSPSALEVAGMVLVLALSTGEAGEVLRALRFVLGSLLRGNLKLFSVVFQHSPQPLEDGEYEICQFCPDATVRNGEIVPVCLADILHPLPKGPGATPGPEATPQDPSDPEARG